MAGEVTVFNWDANMARVATGFKNNPYFNDPIPSPEMTIGTGYPAEVNEKMMMGATDQPTPTDPWVARYPNGKL